MSGASYQERVRVWLHHCFGEKIATDKVERNDRFAEEAMELVQATGMTRERAHALVDYVFNRAPGDPHQEVGGVMNTLAALCLAQGIDLDEAAETELKRVWEKADVIREKQKTKPKGSALPVAASGIDRIAAERRRHVVVEKWTAEHDAGHKNFELTRAAVVYALHAILDERSRPFSRPHGWPWSAEWWKPGTVIRNLEKAGALCAAEIDRLLDDEKKKADG